ARAEALAKAASVIPRPPLANTPILEDQFLQTRWEYALPFETEPQIVGGETFPVVTSVDTEALVGIEEDAWIEPGVVIYAVNGEWVSDMAAIERFIRLSTIPDAQGKVTTSVRIRPSNESEFQHVTLVAPTTRWVELKNGVVLRTESVDGKWRTTVDAITYSDENGLQPGDVILSEKNLGKSIDVSESVEIIVDLLAFKEIDEASFTVSRNGDEITARMPLARDDLWWGSGKPSKSGYAGSSPLPDALRSSYRADPW
ncbi:MAG: hypothetical protein HC844_00815, partial [Tabrizicola sp.]|nr:hypothetical protein [Tabrizicola sp.]